MALLAFVEKSLLSTVDQMVVMEVRGGTLYFLRSERNLNTLIDYRFQQHHKAGRGVNGSGQNRTGHGGDDLFLKVPIGTQVFEEDNKTLIYDFKKEGENLL